MSFIESTIDTSSKVFAENKAYMSELVKKMNSEKEKVLLGGGASNIEKHKSRGKLTARERINLLVDPGSKFLEFSTFAAHNMYEGKAPGAGVVTGIGVIHEQELSLIHI